MSKFNLVMPKLGESVQEATITKWFKKPGDMVDEDEPILEIATDKVDSEIPSPVEGKIIQVLFEENSVVPVGEIVAVISLDGSGEVEEAPAKSPKKEQPEVEETKSEAKKEIGTAAKSSFDKSDKFYSPLVKNIAEKESISIEELDSIKGSGRGGRVKKEDVLSYIKNRGSVSKSASPAKPVIHKIDVPMYDGDEVVEMDRMRKMIAEHMVMSKQVSPHVTNFMEADVTEIVKWRDKVKDEFLKREGVKLTYLPIFTEAIARTLRDFPGVNAAIDGTKIIYRKNINIGIAVALPSGNLIVPVIKNADQKNLFGIALEIDRLAKNARDNKLSPDDIQEGTFSISNFGTFQNLTGTPIINQPQVAIMAVGTIQKKPAVLETPGGDVIAIRHKMILSMSYDHRAIDGALGGNFLKKVADHLEQFDSSRKI